MKNNKKSSHLAVAPIIATLLMVAVAVVGGILIFVFTQGFFADEQVTGFKADSLYLNGYNLKDSTAEDLGDGAASLVCPTASLDGVLGGGDCIILFVQNRGGDPLAIGEVRVMGETYTPSTNTTASDQSASGVTCDDGKDDAEAPTNEFRVYNDANKANLIIEPNADATICLTYNNAKLGDVKAGKVIPIQIVTENGQILLINVKNGVRQTAATGELSVLGGTNAPTNPGPSGNDLTVTAVASGTNNEIDVSWNLVDDQGLPTTYTLTSSPSLGLIDQGVDLTAATASTNCGTPYVFTVSTENSAGDGPSAASASTADSAVTPTAFTGLVVSQENLPNGSVDFNWGTGTGTSDNCDVTFSFQRGIGGVYTEVSTADDGVETFTGISDGDSVTGRAIVTSDHADSPLTTTSSALVYDADCSGLTANNPSISDANNDGTVDVTWSTHSEVFTGCTNTFSLSVDGSAVSSTDDGSESVAGFVNNQEVPTFLTVLNEDTALQTSATASHTVDLDCSANGGPINLTFSGTSSSGNLNWGQPAAPSGCTNVTFEAQYNINGGGYTTVAGPGTTSTSSTPQSFCGVASNGDTLGMKVITTFGGPPSADGTEEATNNSAHTIAGC